MPFLVPTNPVVTVSGTNPVISTGGVTPVITIQDATVEQKGAVQLEDSVSSDSVTKAATSKSVKEAYDYATTTSGTLQTQIDGKSDTDHLHDDRYYTESEVDTISGSLNIAKSDVGHTHTESDITNLDKYTQAEVNTISGSLSAEIGSDISIHEAGDSHDSRYYTETELDNGQLDTRYYTEIEVDTISGTLRTNIDGKSGTDHLHDDRYYTETEVDSLITTISGKLDDHDELNNLDFASSGHTGFQPAGDYLTETEINTISGALSAEIDSDITIHLSDTTAVHGITDTSDLALKSGNINQFSDIISVGADVEAAVDGITPYIIATGETVTIDTDEQLNIVEGYQIDGTGSLEVNGDGSLNINDGPNTGEQDAIFTAADEIKLDDIETSADVTDAVNIGTSIHGVANKTTPINADKVPLIDTEDSNTLKTSTWTNIKAFLKTYFDTLYNKYVHPNHTGAVTSTGDGTTAIADKAVTLFKMNDMATASLLGRNTAATGVPEVLSKTTALSLLNVETGATGDQTGAEIKALYEVEVNAFTDTKNTKLAGIESEATKYPDTGEQAFLDADHTKLNGIETGADVTDPTNVNAAGGVMESDFNAETFLYATSDNTPEVKTPTQVRDILNIGQTSENLIKNSGFWACSRLSSLVSTGSALIEDNMANDDTADWTKSNCTLVFDTDHYVIDPSANYAYIKIVATLKPGHLYKVRSDVKDGTSAGVSITLRVDSCSSETKTTTVAFVSEYFIFHAPLASNWIYLKFGTDPGGNIQIKNFSVYEYNPQFTSTYGADWHRITSTITAERICEDYTHCRGFYGMKLTKGVDTAEYYTFSSATPLPPEYAEVIGMTTVFGMYVYSVSAADNVKIQTVDSAGTTESAFIAADTLTWIEISRSIASSITTHDIRVLLDGDTGDVAYISFCKYSLGDTIGDGNWSHSKNEIITLELYKDSPFFVANTWNDFAYWQSPQGDSGGAVSAQIEAVMVEMYANDSASAATWAYFAAGPGGNTSWTFVLNLSGLVNDAPGWLTGWIHCHKDGRFYFDLEASGTGTFDIGRFRYKGIMVR